jgi:hypothetical protein
MKSNRFDRLALAALLAVSLVSCGGELTNNAAPVELIVTNSQNLSTIDLSGGEDCDQNVGTINMQVLSKNGQSGNLLQVRVNRYRVSYQRTDGGKLIPAPFVRSIDTLIGVGSTGSLSQFTVVEQDALVQAPFVSLLPQNGGRDPDTGRPIVKMDVIVEVFGETLGGDDVYDATRIPLDFCYACGGCS